MSDRWLPSGRVAQVRRYVSSGSGPVHAWSCMEGCGCGFWATLCPPGTAHEARFLASWWPSGGRWLWIQQPAFSRLCRVLEVVVPYLRAVYAKSPSRDDDRPLSERCRERILVRLSVQCRDKALWGACEAVAGRCGVWRGLDDACAMCGAVGKRRDVIGRLCGGANARYCGMWVKRSEV